MKPLARAVAMVAWLSAFLRLACLSRRTSYSSEICVTKSSFKVSDSRLDATPTARDASNT